MTKRLTLIGVPVAFSLLFVVWLFIFGTPAAAAPVMGTPFALPTAIAVQTTSTVTVTIPIPGPSVVGNGVNLLRLGSAGTQPTVMGVMHDDGLNGDAVAGDHIYTLQVSFDQSSTGEIQLEVSAAFVGQLKRVISPPINVAITSDGTMPLPPDPGPAGMATLAGVDSDSDGVRDDVQRYIELTYPLSEKMRVALTQMAISLQRQVLDAPSAALSKTDELLWSYAADCLSFITSTNDNDVAGLLNAKNIANGLQSAVLNTPARLTSYYQAADELGPFTYSSPNFASLGDRCMVKPSSFPD